MWTLHGHGFAGAELLLVADIFFAQKIPHLGIQAHFNKRLASHMKALAMNMCGCTCEGVLLGVLPYILSTRMMHTLGFCSMGRAAHLLH